MSRCRVLLPLVFFSLAVCGIAQTNGIPFVSLPLVPTSVAPGGNGFTLTVNGTGFVSGSVVNWNGVALSTTFVSSSKLTASVPAYSVAAAGTASVTVFSPAPGGGTSSPIPFTVSAPTSSLTFNATTISVGAMPGGIVVADFNNDGKADLAVVNQDQPDPACFSIGGHGTISILLGNGDGTFAAASTVCYPDELQYNAVPLLTVTDLNGDGKPDLIARYDADGEGYVIFYGNGDGTFALGNYEDGWDGLGSVVAADFDADGLMDLAIPSDIMDDTQVMLLLGNGTTTGFEACGNNATMISAGDFNNDGFLDIINNCGEIALGAGNANFNKEIMTGSPPVGSLQSQAVADFDGDGKLDFAMADAGSNSLWLLHGNGDGTFTQVSGEPSLAQFSNDVAVADLNGDGKLDLIYSDDCASPCSVNTIEILLGNGDGTFQPPISETVGNSPQSVAVGDFNGDGRLDIAVANSADNTVTILLQATPALPTVTLSPTSLTFPVETVGTVSKTQTVTITNSGPGVLNLINIATIGQFRHNSHCGPTLNAGASCTVSVIFTPTTIGTLTGGLFVKDNAAGSPQKVTLTGTGTALQIAPAAGLTFDGQAVGSTSSTKSISITNVGGVTVNVSNLAISGSNSADFSQTNTCGASIVSGGNCIIKIKFRPTAIGGRSAQVTITDDGGGSPQQVPLAGTGM